MNSQANKNMNLMARPLLALAVQATCQATAIVKLTEGETLRKCFIEAWQTILPVLGICGLYFFKIYIIFFFFHSPWGDPSFMFITSQDRDFTRQNKYPQLVLLLMSLLLPLLGILQNKSKNLCCILTQTSHGHYKIRHWGKYPGSNRNMESICFKL